MTPRSSVAALHVPWTVVALTAVAVTQVGAVGARVELEAPGGEEILSFPGSDAADPEASAARAEARRLLERALDSLPEPFRLVFILREVEELSVEETAAHLGLAANTVKTRLHRARRQLRRALDAELADVLTGAYPFLGARCARITEAVLQRL